MKKRVALILGVVALLAVTFAGRWVQQDWLLFGPQMDTGLYRYAAGVVKVTTGAAATAGDLIASNLTLSGTTTLSMTSDAAHEKFGASSDVGIARASAGNLNITNGSNGYGAIKSAGETVTTSNGGGVTLGTKSEEITLSTSGATKDSTSTSMLPADSLILGVGCRVTQAIDNVSTWAVGDGSTAARFIAADSTKTLNETKANTGTAWTTGIASATTGIYQATDAALRITTAGGSQNTTGKVRCTVYYLKTVAPTS